MAFGVNPLLAEVTESDAVAAAKAFFDQRRGVNRRASVKDVSALSVISETSEYFNVSRSGGGFVLVAKKEGNIPVIGYSDTGEFDSASAPAAYVAAAVTANVGNDAEYMALYGNVVPVAPLLGEIAWNQSEPYNSQCPMAKEINSDVMSEIRCPAGCVPVALGQIMAYHKFPESYDWSKILPHYTVTSDVDAINEVARLLHDIGVSVNARYGLLATSAYDNDVVENLPGDMGYSPMMTKWTLEYYNPAARRSIIQEELMAKRPVYVSGNSTDSGHAFVCDGIDADGYLHINWGWGGNSNGYYHPLVLAPSGQQGLGSTGSHYNNSTQFITEIRRAEAGDSEGFQLGATEWTPSSVSGNRIVTGLQAKRTQLNYGGLSSYWETLEGAVDIQLLDWGVIISDNDGNKIQSFAGDYDGSLLKVELAGLANGEYRVYPAYRYKGASEWKYLYAAGDVAPFLNLEVSSAGMELVDSFESLNGMEFSVSDFSLPELLTPWDQLYLSIRVGNKGKHVSGARLAVKFTDETTREESPVMELPNHILSLAHGQAEKFIFDISPVFFWIDDKVDFSADDANIVWSKKHPYTLDFYVSNSGEYSYLTSSSGHTVSSIHFSLDDISDPVIKNVLKLNDLNSDGFLSDYEIGRITDLEIINTGAAEIPYLENMKSLNTLHVENARNLNKMDVKGLPSLNTLVLINLPKLDSFELHGHANITSIDFSDLTGLKTLSLKSLPRLQYFQEYNTDFIKATDRSVKMSNLPQLTRIILGNTLSSCVLDDIPMLEALSVSLVDDAVPVDLTQFKSLERLHYTGSKIASLDLSGCKPLCDLTLSAGLEEIKLPAHADWVSINLNHNNLKKIDLPEEMPLLEYLGLGYNRIEELKLPSVLSSLVDITLEDNLLRTIEFPESLPELGANGVGLNIDGNPVESLVLPRSMNKLRYLYIRNTGITELTLPEEMNALNYLDIANNSALETISLVKGYPTLEMAKIWQTRISELYMSDLPSLTSIYAYNNGLTTFGGSNLPALKVLDLGSNKLSSIDVSHYAKLEEINLYGNELTSVDVSHLNGTLRYLDLRDNKMLYNESPFYIEDFQYGSSWFMEIPADGIEIPAGMKIEKIHMRDGVIKGDRILPGGPFKNRIYYQYCDNPDNSSNGLFEISDINSRPSLEKETVGIPVGETGTVTVLTPGGLPVWPANYDFKDILELVEEKRDTEEIITDGVSYIVDVACHFVFKRLKEGDVRIRFGCSGKDSLECLVTSVSGIDDIQPDYVNDGVIDFTAPMEIYNLNGVLISVPYDNLAPGIYIIRQGGIIKKVIVR